MVRVPSAVKQVSAVGMSEPSLQIALAPGYLSLLPSLSLSSYMLSWEVGTQSFAKVTSRAVTLILAP
jgi:hypothetical protein